MSESEQKRIFAKNLNNLIEKHRLTQSEAAHKIGVSPQTFNTWCKGIALPRMGKIQKLSDFFNVDKSELIDEMSEFKDDSHYYLDDDTRELAKFMFENPEYKALFDALRNVSKDDIDFVKEMIDRMSNNMDEN